MADRRQNPRVRCGGSAKIVSLPSEGMAVPGRVLDLSLGGCGIETVFPVPSGTRAEILLRVNAASLRVIGEVQAPRGPRGVGVEFLLLSSYGKDMLADLIRELARQQAVAAIAHTARHQPELKAIRTRPLLLAESHFTAGGLVTLVEAGTKLPLIEQPANQHRTIDAVETGATQDSRILRVEELDLFI
ncbi:MAG: PilZ domain-containing protein [Acidobacteria bacterium]|nr:PilZ domain-containing protein [Acidobacteriota bacterium]